MPSIFGGDHRNRVAAARGRQPGWGIPGHENYMLPATRGMSDPSYVSPLMGGLQPQMGQPQMMGQNSMTPQGPPSGPMGSRPDQLMGPKFGNQTGPVNPGGPPVGMAGSPSYNGPNPRLFEALMQRKPFPSLRGRSRY